MLSWLAPALQIATAIIVAILIPVFRRTLPGLGTPLAVLAGLAGVDWHLRHRAKRKAASGSA